MRTSYYESQVSLAKNYYIFQLSCTIDENNFFFLRKWIEKKVVFRKKANSQPMIKWKPIYQGQ